LVTVLIITDKGQAYAMSDKLETAKKCLESVKNCKVSFISDTEKRLLYLCEAYKRITEGGN
jgi:hypothetical protein